MVEFPYTDRGILVPDGRFPVVFFSPFIA